MTIINLNRQRLLRRIQSTTKQVVADQTTNKNSKKNIGGDKPGLTNLAINTKLNLLKETTTPRSEGLQREQGGARLEKVVKI